MFPCTEAYRGALAAEIQPVDGPTERFTSTVGGSKNRPLETRGCTKYLLHGCVESNVVA